MGKTTAEKIEELEKQLSELKKEVLQKEKWTPPAGDYHIDSQGNIFKNKHYGSKEFGTQFKTEEDAIRGKRDYNFFHCLWHLANELNDGWLPDWDDLEQSKYAIILFNGKLDVRFFDLSYFFVPVFKSRETAEKAIEIIKTWDWYFGGEENV